MKEHIRVLIIEDEPTWQKMITRQLNQDPKFLIVGIAENLEQGINLGKILDYDFIIIDLQLDQTAEDGFVVYDELKKARKIQAIFLTNNENPDTMYRAFLHGGYSYIPKSYLNVLPQTLHYLYENPASNLIMNAVQDRVKEYRLTKLTSAERNIFDLLNQGLKPKKIAEDFNISLYTVRSHIKNVLKKLALNDYREAIKKLYSSDCCKIENQQKSSSPLDSK
ncbi:MAG: response regulator transcription factor [Firmicutes bacterium]|nr:response regulator transcription factor [Bacillota bacterium]